MAEKPALLSRADEVRLAQRIERGDPKARDAMIESNLRLVHAVARTFRASGVPHADLVQEGTIGLVRAVELFDHRRGVKFSTYAVWWIRRSMRDAVAGSNAIRIPPKARQQLAAVRYAETELRRLSSRRASDGEIAALTELSVETVRSLRTAAQVTASLDEPVGEDTTPLGDMIADPRTVDPSESAIAHEQRDDVSAMLLLLPKRHREVLVRRYGLNGSRVQSHDEIGRWLGVGEERSRQIEHESLRRMRSILTAATASSVHRHKERDAATVDRSAQRPVRLARRVEDAVEAERALPPVAVALLDGELRVDRVGGEIAGGAARDRDVSAEADGVEVDRGRAGVGGDRVAAAAQATAAGALASLGPHERVDDG